MDLEDGIDFESRDFTYRSKSTNFTETTTTKRFENLVDDFNEKLKLEDVKMPTTSQDKIIEQQQKKKSIRIVSVGPQRFNNEYFNDLAFGQGDKIVSKETKKEYNDPIIDACDNQQLFAIKYIGQKGEYSLVPMKKYVIQQEVKEEAELVKGTSFFIGDTLFEVTQADAQLKCSCIMIGENGKQSLSFKTQFSEGETIFKIGRTTLQFLKEDKLISREHAEVVKRDNKFFIYKSNKNANKVWLCQPHDQQLLLKEGMNIRIGLTCERQIREIFE